MGKRGPGLPGSSVTLHPQATLAAGTSRRGGLKCVCAGGEGEEDRELLSQANEACKYRAKSHWTVSLQKCTPNHN